MCVKSRARGADDTHNLRPVRPKADTLPAWREGPSVSQEGSGRSTFSSRVWPLRHQGQEIAQVSLWLTGRGTHDRARQTQPDERTQEFGVAIGIERPVATDDPVPTAVRSGDHAIDRDPAHNALPRD
jgi:hypothetical protein